MTEEEKKLNSTWRNMKYRCYAPNAPQSLAKLYRDKGIRVCDEWRNDFNAFKEWAFSHGYEVGLTIDRIDPDGDYEPSNCQWVTKSENSRRALSKEEKRFYVAKGKIERYSRKFLPTEILSDSLTYNEATAMLQSTYPNDSDHYRVVRSRHIPPEPERNEESKQHELNKKRLLDIYETDTTWERVKQLSEPSKLVIGSTILALLMCEQTE